jgi:hypothetical protein
MTTFAMWATLLFLLVSAPVPAPSRTQTQNTTQAVSLLDLLVEAQTLYTMAVDKQKESLTAALDLARQAQRVIDDGTVKKRTSAGVRPDPQDLTVLGALRARISVLVGDIQKKREYYHRQYEDIQKLIQQKRVADARSALDRLPADAPTADPDCPFADLRADLKQTIAVVDDYRAQAATAKALGLADDAIALYRRAQAIDPTGADYDALGADAREHAAWLMEKRRQIRLLLTSHRLTSAAREVSAIEATLPANTKLYQLEVLKAELVLRQQEFAAAVQAAEEAMVARKYSTAERLWRDAAAIDREQPFDDQIRRAKELGGGKSWVAKIFRPDVWLKKPVTQIRALVRAVHR